MSASRKAALAAIGDQKPDTMGGHLQLMSAFRLAITGWGFRSMASGMLLPKARAALAALQGKSPAVLGNKATANELAQTVLPAVGSIARAIVGRGIPLHEMTVARKSLEAWFLDVMGDEGRPG